MRTLRKIDIDAMERELSIMLNEEQSSTQGGVYIGCGDIAGKDCIVQTMAYLSGASYDSIVDMCAASRVRTLHPGEQITTERLDEARSYVTTNGQSPAEAQKLFESMMGTSHMYYTGNEYSEDAESAITGNQGPIMAFVNVNGSNHTVAVTSYDSGTFNYWDEQRGCSGSFNWEDLELFIVTGETSGNM